MEKYNYDFIADQEPDGNSEWYPAKEVEKEIEQYKHTLTHDTKEIKLLTAEIDQKDEEIERLRKLVKEAYSEGWHDCYEHHKEYSILGDWYKSEIKLKVEQALKESE
ncbi:hypothetical protein LCGC14_2137920 [marine sediment metagenome]|uniref:Uncharacterized protein n=1 Tax=marine sediment metagenome TaxID=412755 RepID=A0A0F9GCB1_9ZZZZ